MQAILEHLRTWNPNGNGLVSHEQLTSVFKELAPATWNDTKIAKLLGNAPDPMSIKTVSDLLNVTSITNLEEKLKAWDPNANGKLSHEQLKVLLKSIDAAFWTDEQIALLFKALPDPATIEEFARSLYPESKQPAIAFRNISDDELIQLAESRGMKVEYAEKTMTLGDAKASKRSLAIDPSLCKKLKPDEEEAIRSIFNNYDKDGSGSVDLAELKAMIAEMGGRITDTQVEAAMKQLDTSGDGKCDFEEFCCYWTSKPGLGGYDDVALQLMKGALVSKAGAKKGMTKMAKKSREFKIPEGKSALNASFVVSPNMGPFETKMNGKLTLAKGGDPESKEPSFTLKIATSDEKSATSTRDVINEFTAFLFQEMAADASVEELPFILFAETDGTLVSVVIKLKAEGEIGQMFEDPEFLEAKMLATMFYDSIEATFDWSNDISDLVTQDDKLPFELIGGVKVAFDAFIEYGFLRLLGGPEQETEMAMMALEGFGGAGMDVKLGYFAEHLRTVGQELKALGAPIMSLKKVQAMIEQNVAGDMPQELATDDSCVKGFSLISKTLKELSASATNLQSISLDGVGEIQASIAFEKFKPWLLASYLMKPILDKFEPQDNAPRSAATAPLAKDIGDKERERIREVFDKYDKDKSGAIDLKELEAMIQELGGKITTEEAQQAIQQLDKDGSFTVNFDEFLLWWSSTPGLGGYSSVALSFLRMKMNGWNALMKGKKMLVKNTLGVTEDSDTLITNSIDLATHMNPTQANMSASVSFDQEVSATDSADQCAELRLTANSGDDATKCVELLQAQWSMYSEMLAELPINVEMLAEGEDVVIKVSAPAQMADMVVQSGDPEMFVTITTAVQSMLNSSSSISFGSCIEEWIERADEPLPELLAGAKVEAKTGVSAAGRQMIASLAMGMPAEIEKLFRPLVRSFAGFHIGYIMGYKPKPIVTFLTKMLEMVGMPPEMLTLNGLRNMFTAFFPEELAGLLPTVIPILECLKGVKSITTNGFVPKPGAEGSKLNVKIDFEKFALFPLVLFFLKPLAPSDEMSNEMPQA